MTTIATGPVPKSSAQHDAEIAAIVQETNQQVSRDRARVAAIEAELASIDPAAALGALARQKARMNQRHEAEVRELQQRHLREDMAHDVKVAEARTRTAEPAEDARAKLVQERAKLRADIAKAEQIAARAAGTIRVADLR